MGECGTYIDDLTVCSRTGSTWTTDLVERFTLNASGYAEDQPTHDFVGNLAYDGLYAFTYDAWNRLASVKRAFRDPENQNTLQYGSTVSSMSYDGLDRRIAKSVTNCGDWSFTYDYYHDGRRVLEERNGASGVIKRFIYGTQYQDEVVRIDVNVDPSTNEGSYVNRYVVQDANYNVIALADSTGQLVERYEYTPYGERTVYKQAGTADNTVTAPSFNSAPGQWWDVDTAFDTCDLGHPA